MGVYHERGSTAKGRTSICDVGHDFENKWVFERVQDFSFKCHGIDFHKLSFKHPIML